MPTGDVLQVVALLLKKYATAYNGEYKVSMLLSFVCFFFFRLYAMLVLLAQSKGVF